MEQETDKLLAVHRSCYEIVFRLYDNRLTFENPALDYRGEIAVDDVLSVSVVCDGLEKLKVRVRCVTKQNRTITVLDNDEGNYLLTRFIELCAACRPDLKIRGFLYDIDVRTAYRNGAYAFAVTVLLLLATAALFLCRVPLALSVAAAVLTFSALGFFFFRRGGYRDLIELRQLFDLEKEREKQAVRTRAAELKYLADLPPAEKRRGLLTEYAETMHALTLLGDGASASFDVKKVLGMLVSRRTKPENGEAIPTETLDAWKTAIVTPAQALPDDAFSIPAHSLYRLLKVTTVTCTPGGRYPYAAIEAAVENIGDSTVDGAILGSVRHDGTVVGTAYFPLPADGIPPHTKVILSALTPLTVKADPEKTVVWYEEYQLWKTVV